MPAQRGLAVDSCGLSWLLGSFGWGCVFLFKETKYKKHGNQILKNFSSWC